MHPENKKIDFILNSLFLPNEELLERYDQSKDVIDWTSVLDFAKQHKIHGILIKKWTESGLTALLEKNVLELFQSYQKEARERIHRSLETLKQIQKAFNDSHIPFLIFKGSAFAYEYYASPEMRPHHDIDMLVLDKDISESEKILNSLGYRFWWPSTQFMDFIPLGHVLSRDWEGILPEASARETYRRYHFHFPMVVPQTDKRLDIDLHWHVFRPDKVRFDAQLLWSGTRYIKIEGMDLKTFSRENAFLYLAVQTAKKGPEGFKLLTAYDLVQHLRFFNTQADIDRLDEVKTQWGCQREVAFSLELVNRLFSVDVSRFLKGKKKRKFANRLIFELTVSKHPFLREYKRYIGRVFHMALYSCCWDLNMMKFPRRAIKGFIRSLILILRKKGLLPCY